MGQGFSDWGPEPLYTRNPDPDGNAPYDWWGYIPGNFTPSQHVWHTYFSDPDAKAAMNFPIKDDPRPKSLQYGIVSSLPEMILKGRYPTTDQPLLPGGPRFASDVFPGENYFDDKEPGVIKKPDQKAWTERWIRENNPDVPPEPGLHICTPLNFPFCTMEPIAEGAGISRDFAGRIQNSMQLWENTIDNLYEKFYVNGNVDALGQINSDDTSDFDPCAQPGLLARLAPIILGAVTGGGFQKLFAPDMRNTFTSNTMMVWSVGTASFGFFFMRGAMDVYGPQETNIAYSAASIALPAGLSIGEWLINKGTFNVSNTTLYAAGLAISYVVLYQGLKNFLILPAPLNFVVRLVGGLVEVVSRFLCRLTNPEDDACAAKDKDGHKLFSDARRWDAASIAAMLTEEVRSEEGWERDDPRCEFAYKAFLTGPAMLDAARGKRSDKMPMWTHNTGNPVGSIYAPQALQSTVDGLTFASGPVYGWDGNERDIWSVADSNKYACQNWYTLRGIGVPPRSSNPESLSLSRTFDEWVKAVRDAANIPANLAHAGVGRETSAIPGWKGGSESLEPLAPHLTNVQALDLINAIYAAPDVAARYELVRDFDTRYVPPPDDNMTLWLQANQQIYTFMQLKPGRTPDDIWVYLQGFFLQGAKHRSAFIYAATATSSPQLWEFWSKSPTAMVDAAKLFPPPPGLPFGLTAQPTTPPVNLGPSQHHWHWSTPLEPVQGGQSLCAEFLGKLRGTIDDPNSRNFTVFQWQQACKIILGRVDPKICTACSMGQVCTVFAYSLFFDAYDNAGAGVGWFCDQLKNKFKWSDISVAAALQNLNTSLDYNSNLKNYMAFWWGQYDWSVTNWYEYVQKALKVEGAHYDDTANICGSMTSLTPLQRQEQPLTDEHLSRLFDPASERPKDFKSYVTNVAGSFYKLFTGETPITDLMPHDPISLHWQDNEWSRHVYRPLPPGWDPGFPVPIHWDNPPPELKHLQAPPSPPSPPDPLPTHIYWPNPPPDFKSLQKPPAPGHITPFPLPMDPLYPHPPDPSNTNYCAVIFDALQNPPNAQWTNLSGTQMRTILAPMFTLQSCTDCEWADRMNLWMYYIVNPQGQAFANGVGNWIDQNTNPQWTPNPWSDDALSAGLNALQQPLHNQENLSGYITAFMSNPVASNGTDYTAKIKQLLQSPGNWDRTPGFCGP